MTIQAIIFLFGLVSSVVCNSDTYVYSEFCVEPVGMVTNDTGVTTPDYVTLSPIERCCPQCDHCKEKGGYCALKWAVEIYSQCCDFTPIEPCRDYGCKCCIKCNDDKCSPCTKTGGECRKECRSGELEDLSNICSYHNNGEGCKCCKHCEPTNECALAYGTCRTDPAWCPFGTYASTGCCGGCVCCKPSFVPLQGSNCEYSGGYCLDEEEGEGVCATGYYACFGECIKSVYHDGLKSEVLGTCCIPKYTEANNRIDQYVAQEQQQQNNIRHHPKQLLD